MMCLISYAYYLIPVLILILIPLAIMRNRKIMKHYEDLYKRSYDNQAEMIALLREIRDALTKRGGEIL